MHILQKEKTGDVKSSKRVPPRSCGDFHPFSVVRIIDYILLSTNRLSEYGTTIKMENVSFALCWWCNFLLHFRYVQAVFSVIISKWNGDLRLVSSFLFFRRKWIIEENRVFARRARKRIIVARLAPRGRPDDPPSFSFASCSFIIFPNRIEHNIPSLN